MAMMSGGVQMFSSYNLPGRKSSRVVAPPGGQCSKIFFEDELQTSTSMFGGERIRRPSINQQHFSSRKSRGSACHIQRKSADTSFGWYTDEEQQSGPYKSTQPQQQYQYQHPQQQEKLQQQCSVEHTRSDSPTDLPTDLTGPSPGDALKQRNGQSRDEFLQERLMKLEKARKRRDTSSGRSEGDENLAVMLKAMTIEIHPGEGIAQDIPIKQKIEKAKKMNKKQATEEVSKPGSKSVSRNTKAAAASRSTSARSATNSRTQKSASTKAKSSETVAKSREAASARSRRRAVARAQAEVEATLPYSKKPQTRGARMSTRVVAPPGGRSTLRFG